MLADEDAGERIAEADEGLDVGGAGGGGLFATEALLLPSVSAFLVEVSIKTASPLLLLLKFSGGTGKSEGVAAAVVPFETRPVGGIALAIPKSARILEQRVAQILLPISLFSSAVIPYSLGITKSASALEQI